MLAHVPGGRAIVAEPVAPDEWAREVAPGTVDGVATPTAGSKYPSLFLRIAPDGALAPALHRTKSASRTTSARSRPALIGYYERARLLLGDQRLDRVRARVRRPAARCRRRSPTTARWRAQGEVVYRASPYARGAGPGRVQLRLELRLLPARLRPARAGDDGLPAARGAVRQPEPDRAAWRGYPGQDMPSCTDTDTSCTWRGRSSSRATAPARSSPTRSWARWSRATARSWARAGTRSTAARTRRSTRSRRAAWPT